MITKLAPLNSFGIVFLAVSLEKFFKIFLGHAQAMKSRQADCFQSSKEVRLANESASEDVKLLEKLSGSDAVVENVLFDAQDELTELHVARLCLLEARMASLARSERLRDINFPDFRSRDLFGVNGDESPGKELLEVSASIFDALPVEPVHGLSKLAQKCGVIDREVVFHETLGEQLKLTVAESDSREVENATEVRNRHRSGVVGAVCVVLKSKF